MESRQQAYTHHVWVLCKYWLPSKWGQLLTWLFVTIENDSTTSCTQSCFDPVDYFSCVWQYGHWWTRVCLILNTLKTARMESTSLEVVNTWLLRRGGSWKTASVYLPAVHGNWSKWVVLACWVLNITLITNSSTQYKSYAVENSFILFPSFTQLLYVGLVWTSL